MTYMDQLRKCRSEEEFREIWDSDRFHWNYSYYLCIHCSKYIHIWWNPDKFNWKWTNLLHRYCKQYKDIWEKDYIIKKLEGEVK